MDIRPLECRFRQADEGRPYPKSSCHACGRGILSGLGRRCHKETEAQEALETRIAFLTAENERLAREVKEAREAAARNIARAQEEHDAREAAEARLAEAEKVIAPFANIARDLSDEPRDNDYIVLDSGLPVLRFGYLRAASRFKGGGDATE